LRVKGDLPEYTRTVHEFPPGPLEESGLKLGGEARLGPSSGTLEECGYLEQGPVVGREQEIRSQLEQRERYKAAREDVWMGGPGRWFSSGGYVWKVNEEIQVHDPGGVFIVASYPTQSFFHRCQNGFQLGRCEFRGNPQNAV